MHGWIRRLLATGWLALTLSAPSAIADPPRPPWIAIVEAEEMVLSGDWRVVTGQEGYFPAAPNTWSGNRIRAGNGPEPADATASLDIPADGRYAIWLRAESPYGFDVHTRLTLHQDGTAQPVFDHLFGDRADLKYFNGAWRVQGPWSYHNTDYVYQKAVADLRQGPARLTLSKGPSHARTAARIVDLVMLTDDLALEPGRELNAWLERGTNPAAFYRPAVMANATRPAYFRIRVDPAAPAPARVVLAYRFGSGWRGPQRDLAFTAGRTLTERVAGDHALLERRVASGKGAFPQEELLPPGFDSGWLRYDLSRFETATVTVRAGAPATLGVSHHADGRDGASFPIPADAPTAVLVAVGNDRLEAELFAGRPAVTPEDIARRFADALNAFPVPGKRPLRFGNLVSPPPSFGPVRWPFFEAVGASGFYFSVPPDLYRAENAVRWGVDRSIAYPALQNAGLAFECYEGDYAKLRQRLEALRTNLESNGVGDIPLTFKMIEESGPPPLAKLAASAVIRERFRAYLKSTGLKPAELLTRADLAAAVAAGHTADADLWERVNLCEGLPRDAEANPILFYHSKRFGSLLFADNAAAVTRLVESIFPPGSRANYGAAYPQTGHGVRRNWYDEFMLFRRRGMTSFGSETTWGLNGTPDYVGAQSQSYEGTIARGVAKYHDATLGPTHLLACKRYGYPADYVDLTAYALASHGYRSVHYYLNADFTGLDHYKAMKRAGYALGAVEDRLVGARAPTGRIALAWSETTAIWDQAVPTESGYNRPGNLNYALERHYLYLLLRHLQWPVDLLSEADIEEGRLRAYPVLFWVGDHMTRACAEALRGWVGDGGVLIAGAGGGLWDEYDRPLDTLKEVYGIKGARQYAREQGREYIPGEAYAANPADNRLEKVEQSLRAKLELVHAHPLDTIVLGNRRLPVMGYRQSFAVEGGHVAATFASGGPAIVTNGFGKGRTVLMGFLPGIAYLYQAFPLLPYGRGGEDLSGILYPDYKPEVREAVAELLTACSPGAKPPVETSNPYVEANLLVKDGAWHIALVNFSGRPIPDLHVRIRRGDVGGATGATATFSGATADAASDEIRLTLPLDKFEWLTLHGPK